MGEKNPVVAESSIKELVSAKLRILLGENREFLSGRRRLVSLPLSTQESLYGLPAIQPTETIHAVENAGAEGMPLGQLAAIPIATVLIGFTLFRSVKALLKRFRTPQKGKASTSGNDTGIT